MAVEPDTRFREGDYEIVSAFEAQFNGRCTIVSSHKIKRGDVVSKVQRTDNPLLPISGVACKICTRDLPRAS